MYLVIEFFLLNFKDRVLRATLRGMTKQLNIYRSQQYLFTLKISIQTTKQIWNECQAFVMPPMLRTSYYDKSLIKSAYFQWLYFPIFLLFVFPCLFIINVVVSVGQSIYIFRHLTLPSRHTWKCSENILFLPLNDCIIKAMKCHIIIITVKDK